jgi:hypothetical protein
MSAWLSTACSTCAVTKWISDQFNMTNAILTALFFALIWGLFRSPFGFLIDK